MSEISRQEFQRRRQALVEQMQPGSAALIFAAPEVTRSADSEYPYRQNSDFWYFTGFNEPEAVLVLIKSDDTHNHSVHTRAMEKCRPGMFEYHLEGEIHHEFNRHGARYPSYNTIVGSGENGCILHYTENESELRDGDLVLIDAGCEYKGYAGDITRTFPVNGKFTQAQREIYDIVLESLETSLRLYRPGTSMQEVTGEVVRIMVSGLVKLGILKGDVDELIAQNAHRPFFMHGLSHWLGLDVHDVGVYGQDRSRILEPGMVLTVEPGLYIAPDADVPEQYRGIGIRIEDDIVITETGNENLTASVVKKPEEIEALMAAARKQ
ncbi:Xaa-Pro aminopeptidase [Escherichia coli]